MSDADKSNRDGSQAEPQPARRLPDVAVCRAKASGFASYVDCLVDSPQSCRYAFSIGGYVHCDHPEREAIVARTEV